MMCAYVYIYIYMYVYISIYMICATCIHRYIRMRSCTVSEKAACFRPVCTYTHACMHDA